MRMNIVIDDSLMRQAMQATGLLTQKAIVEEGLSLLVKVKGQVGVRRLRGKIVFDGGIRQMEKGEQLQ